MAPPFIREFDTMTLSLSGVRRCVWKILISSTIRFSPPASMKSPTCKGPKQDDHYASRGVGERTLHRQTKRAEYRHPPRSS